METIYLALQTDTLIRILLLGFLGFLVSMLITPIYTTLAYRWQWWKKPRTVTTGQEASAWTQLPAERHKRLVPTMAGVIMVAAVCLVTLPFNLSRAETWLPLAAFAGAALVGLLDDIVTIRGRGSGLRAKLRLFLTAVVALIGGLFFYFKLDTSSIHIPVVGTEWQIGWFIIPLFVLVVVATANAVNISDGLDGLAGGLAATAFGAYAIIAALEGRFGVSGFCMTIVGALLSYTWFNVHPARFFMGDVGSFALGTALGVVAMLTDTMLLLPLIGLVFLVEAGSSILQTASKKLRGGKTIFKVAPIHHHFEASGWPETKVTMRLWVVGQVCAVLGLILFLVGRYL
ncbi:MAG TPA: phospho-N-acetylmuramoyl-pentapeptide-transferase [Candidatus Saccharimonadales bacterium]|nr:phospho-N-acetylmuramoyl-pentapeptide-transferase [Candidatus Saccharimonadales bacterium]